VGRRAKRTFFHARDFFPKTGMALYVSRTPRHADTGPHGHDFTELVIVFAGSGTHDADGEVYPLSAGDVFVIPQGARHSYRDTTDLALANILFDERKLRLPVADLGELPGYHALFALEPRFRKEHGSRSRLRLGPDDLADAEGILGRLTQELSAKPAGYRYAATTLLMELIVRLSRSYSTARKPESRALLRIAKVLSYCETHYDEPVTLEQLAGLARMSKSTLLRRFQAALNTTPMAHLIALRIRHASRLLRETDLTVTEIAFRTGFSDSNYFSRTFRAHTGTSPRAWRRG